MSVYREDLQKAVRWLKGNQNDDGGWGEHRSNAMCTTMASYALFETRRLMHYLKQNKKR
jgi:squalene cyclase